MSAPVLRRDGTPTSHGRWIAGGTTLVDLMKLHVEAPTDLVDLGPRRAALSGIKETPGGLWLGAMTTMAEAERNPLLRTVFPAAHLALALAASPQIREMATLGGNLLQRTRCPYFRDGRSPCNKRTPGSGCSGIGSDEALALLGTSDQCVAPYAGDLAVALVMLDADLMVEGRGGAQRRVAIADLHRQPGDTPDIETALAADDLIVAIELPRHDWTEQTYVKTRDRASYAFARVSAAVALRLERGVVAGARIVLGGIATVPWRCRAAEAWLVGRRLSQVTAMQAGRACFKDARAVPSHAYQTELGIRTVAKALLDAGAPARASDA